MTPTVSVLLPVRDGGSHLAEAIASLEAQTLSDFEAIAVDDGSTDTTAQVLDAWARRDERVRVVPQEAKGIVPALETARALARATYLARMDADDWSHPTRFAEQLALMEADPTVVASGCGVEYFPDESVRDGARRYEGWLNSAHTPDEVARQLFVECPLAHPTFFMRAHAVEAVGGYRDRGWPEDYDLILRLWEAGGRFSKVPARLLRWREGDGRLSRTHPRYSPEAFLACKVHYLRRTLLKGRTGVVIWGAGPVGKAAARALLEAGTRVLAFVDVDPRKLGQDIHGAMVLGAAEGVEVEGAVHLAAVGQPGQRDQITSVLRGAGLAELHDFVAIA